jgi:hypothetical protein
LVKIHTSTYFSADKNGNVVFDRYLGLCYI